MAVDATSPRRAYIFGPRETRGLLIGLRGSQLAVVLIGLTLFVVGLSFGFGGALVGTFAVVIAGTAAFVPISGRTLEQWAPVALAFLVKRISGSNAYRRDLTAEPVFPPHLADVRILSVPVLGGHPVGVVEDVRRGTLSAVMSIGGDTFLLLDPEVQERRASAWGALLSGLARDGSPVIRVQWLARSVPETGQALRQFWERSGSRIGASAVSYQQLHSGVGSRGWRTETYLTVVIKSRRGRSRGRSSPAGLPAAASVLTRELAAVEERLARSDLDVVGWLPPRGLAAVVRDAYEPGSRVAVEGRMPDEKMDGVDPAVAGPMAAYESWSTYRTDDAWHATYWIHEWPRIGVGSDFLAPMLTSSTSRRTLTLIAEPVDARQAARQSAAARTAHLANEAMRQRLGQLTTERERVETADVEQRERELVAGHSEFRFVGLLTVTASTPELLDQGCADAEVAAHACYLEIRRLYGEQDQAFAAALVLGRGLR